jgi:hypothetical protein
MNDEKEEQKRGVGKVGMVLAMFMIRLILRLIPSVNVNT